MRCPGQLFREEGNKRQQEGKNVTQKEIKDILCYLLMLFYIAQKDQSLMFSRLSFLGLCKKSPFFSWIMDMK